MKIDIPIGTRGTLKDFKKSYQSDFLEKYGYKRYTKNVPFSARDVTICEAVNVKYGDFIKGKLIVHDSDILTYLGHKLWAVIKEGKDAENGR